MNQIVLHKEGESTNCGVVYFTNNTTLHTFFSSTGLEKKQSTFRTTSS